MNHSPKLSALILVSLLSSSPAAAIDCTHTSTGLVPINDLGTGFYKGFQGGLYPGGANVRPPAHTQAGLDIANTTIPLDTLGGPDPVNGRIVLLSIGMSNTSIEFSAFIPKADADPQKNPRVLVVNGAIGGMSADRIDSPTDAYWDSVVVRLRSVGSSPRQAQIVWLKEAIANPTGGFPASTDTLGYELSRIARIIHDKFPNVRLTYLTSRIYAGYATTTLNPEPYAYESGFAVKGLIEKQIAGAESLNFDPTRGAVTSPWLSWGPYLWADGLNPRSDGLTWPCSDFQSDGTHPNAMGAGIVADSLLAFFKSDPTATPWFVQTTTGAPVSAREAQFQVAPNPTRGNVDLTFQLPSGESWRVDVFDVRGRRVGDAVRGVGTGAAETVRWEPSRGERIGSGVYWLRLTRGRDASTRRIAVLNGF